MKTTTAPELQRLSEMFTTINATLTPINDPALRSAIACAAVEQLIQEGQMVIQEFKKGAATR